MPIKLLLSIASCPNRYSPQHLCTEFVLVKAVLCFRTDGFHGKGWKGLPWNAHRWYGFALLRVVKCRDEAGMVESAAALGSSSGALWPCPPTEPRRAPVPRAHGWCRTGGAQQGQRGSTQLPCAEQCSSLANKKEGLWIQAICTRVQSKEQNIASRPVTGDQQKEPCPDFFTPFLEGTLIKSPELSLLQSPQSQTFLWE